MHYSIAVENVVTGSVANTFTSLLGLVAGTNTGERGRLLRLKVTPSGEATQDINVLCRLTKSNQDTAGTNTSATTAIKKKDALSRASIMTAAKQYTVEPTTVDTPHFASEAFNGRGGFSEWWDPQDAPHWGPTETLLVQCAPGTAAAVKCTISAEWEEY